MTNRTHAGLIALSLAACLTSVGVAQQTTPPPPPRPFPGAQPPPGSSKPATPASTAATQAAGVVDGATFDPALAGIQIYPAAQLLEQTLVSESQRVFIFGSNDAYAAIVTFYKNVFRRSGEEVSRMPNLPNIHQFDVGSFNAGTMYQRPSVIVKDYTWPDALGYIHVDGTVEKRFKTLIQIIPASR